MDLLDVEFSIGEDLGEFSVLEMLVKPEDTTVRRIDDVSIAVDSVTLLIDALPDVIFKMTVSVLNGHDVSILILIHNSHDVLDVETLALVVVEFGHVTIRE